MRELADALRAQRIELAGEVHDRIIPSLFAARMQLEALAARLNQSAPTGPSSHDASAVAVEVAQAVDLIQCAITTSRQLLSELAPHQTGGPHWDAQLRQALGDSAVDLQQSGQLPWDQIGGETAITITLIAAEAIRNATRHGKPTGIEVTAEPLDWHPKDAIPAAGHSGGKLWQLVITDDGRGFDPAKATTHHGLALMRFRAAAIGGDLQIRSQPGGPTQVSLRWPV